MLFKEKNFTETLRGASISSSDGHESLKAELVHHRKQKQGTNDPLPDTTPLSLAASRAACQPAQSSHSPPPPPPLNPIPPAPPCSMAAKWAQKTVVIPAQRRGCHLITPKVYCPSRASPHRLARTIQGVILLLIAILSFLCRVLQVLREIEGDLSGFKCGLAHLFRMYR